MNQGDQQLQADDPLVVAKQLEENVRQGKSAQVATDSTIETPIDRPEWIR